MLEKTYNPRDVEDRIYAFWEANTLFPPEVNPDAKTPFSIVIPPPNVTGTLHIGHALDNTLQDILIRWHRMVGDKTLWMPGMDHAGIATQNVVERNLREQGISKTDLGREKFVDTVWEWANARKVDIYNQFKRLGISPDWKRSRFTLDDGCSQAVRKAFVSLYDRKLIFRGTYIVNWCPRCTSAISDIETDHIEVDGNLWAIKYPLSDGSGEIVVETTRPETMFGDVAVAVHPEDDRYKALIGKTVKLPLNNAEIPIIGDDYVDREFGSGAVKITPAHDANDYEMSKRHKLDAIWVLDDTAHMMACERVPSELHGLERFDARKKTEALLEAQGFLMGKKPHTHNVGHCQRCSTRIEPYLSKQWFVDGAKIAKDYNLANPEAIGLTFYPERWTKIYVDWMANMREWCISRQLWWGHQIPAWYCGDCEQITVAETDPSACQHCQSKAITQDTDVLDTWFSSGLWPFSTMGWPDTNAADFQTYYPTSVLVTGFDIIFFWVARMVMFGKALTDQTPFHTVYIHGLVRDEKGQKMSKSKGNTIDPVDIMNDTGTDAMRFALTSLVTYGGQDIKLSKDSFDQSRLFANKLWNASRFVLMNIEDVDDQPLDESLLSDLDKWILNQLYLTTYNANKNLNEYRFGEVCDLLYQFIWNTFCDRYVEGAKVQLNKDDFSDASKANTKRVLLFTLRGLLKLLHPIMPYITEEIWQQLPHKPSKSIMVNGFGPELPAGFNAEAVGKAVEDLDFLFELIKAGRNIRQTANISYKIPIDLGIELDPNSAAWTKLMANQHFIQQFLNTEGIKGAASYQPADEELVGIVDSINGTTRVFVTPKGVIDTGALAASRQKKRENLQKEADKLQGMLGNPGFTGKAPAHLIEQHQQRLAELKEQLDILDSELAKMV